MRRGLLTALVIALACTGANVHAEPRSSHGGTSRHPCLIVVGDADAPFVRHFNPFTDPLDFTWGGIYEPLVVVTTAGGGHTYDWLASALRWSDHGKTLTLTVRHGVSWSDGRPLTNRDVLYTLTAGRQEKVMDQIGLTRPGNQVASIELVGADKVAIHLKARNSMFVATVLANNLSVVPEHVFSHVRRVATWENPDPVGSGPFAVVQRFGLEAYVLGRNPHYWLKGTPHFPCIARMRATSSESAVLQMVRGNVDLSNVFVPNVERTYVAHDPADYHFFYPANAVPVGLFFDDTRYPFSLVALRKGLSLAIDRSTISQLAENGYAPPVDAIGIGQIWPDWVSPALAAEAARLATYDPAAARRTLLAAGFRYERDTLLDPRGDPVVLRATVIESWSDWVTTWRIITHNLRDIGITVKLELAPTWGDWEPDAFSTRKATLLWNNFGNAPTPYPFFEEHFDRSAFVQSGKDADLTGNWEHFQSSEGTRLLREFRNTFDPQVQHRLATRLERLWLDTLPFVPLFAGPEWSTYSTRHFTGFPSARDFYLQPSFFTSDYAVALTRIRPV